MSKVVQDHFPRTISQYVPAMEFAADVVGDVAIVNLGAPAAPDAAAAPANLVITNSHSLVIVSTEAEPSASSIHANTSI